MLISLLGLIGAAIAGVVAASGVVIIGNGIAERPMYGYDDIIDAPPRKYKSYDKTDEQIEYLCRVRREAKMRGEHIC